MGFTKTRAYSREFYYFLSFSVLNVVFTFWR